MTDIILVGIAGGSGSGKTTFTNRLCDTLDPGLCTVIAQDSYYIDQSQKFDHDGGSVNFDHPDSLDFELMAKQLQDLKNGLPIEVPIYDFATHSRISMTNKQAPKKIVFVDGILIFASSLVANILDKKIFIDCPEALRFNRRLKRDVKERGRTPEGVKAQFELQVKPMHDQFVAPSMKIAEDVVNQDNFDQKLAMWTEFLLNLAVGK